MAISVHCTRYSRNANGTIFLDFSNGQQKEFSSVEVLQAYADDVDSPDQADAAMKMLFKLWLLQDPAAENSGLVVGKELTFDLTAQPPIFVQGL